MKLVQDYLWHKTLSSADLPVAGERQSRRRQLGRDDSDMRSGLAGTGETGMRQAQGEMEQNGDEDRHKGGGQVRDESRR